MTTTRRGFLRASGRLSGTLWLASTGITALAPSSAWSLELMALSSDEGRVLQQLSRHIFPHDTLDDAVYALVVKDLDSAALGDTAMKRLLQDGVAALHASASGDWLAGSSAAQLASVTAIAGNPFFDAVRSTAVVSLYNNELAFAHFGYPGGSFEHGGYLHRGFDDLDWLPAPPPHVSPRV